MPDPPNHPSSPASTSSSHPVKYTHEDAAFVGGSGSQPVSYTMIDLGNPDRLDDRVGSTRCLPTSSRVPRDAVIHASQLPTPRTHSHANVLPYFPGVAGSPESPLAHTHSRGLVAGSSLTPRVQPRSNSPAQDIAKPAFRQPLTLTPETSPGNSLAHSDNRPVSAPLLSSAPQGHRIVVKTESPPLTLAPAHVISSHGSSHQRSPLHIAHSNLSSPFVEKTRGDQTAISRAESSGMRPVELLTPQPMPHPVNAAELFSSPRIVEGRPSPVQSKHRTPPQFADDVTQTTRAESTRQPGGELDRIRNHMSSMEAAHRLALESRRPEFFKRLQRSDDVGPARPIRDEGSDEKTGLAITTSPMKGRRLQLFDFQETSAESFEESLMTHGYGTYGEPRTPQRPITAADGRSQEAMHWLAYNTPAASATLRQTHLENETGPSEKELKKRKRLEAFNGSTARAYAKLYPAEIDGLGRVLLNVPPEDADDLLGSPLKKRAAGKKKKGAAIADKKGKGPARDFQERAGGTEPRWLDKEYPWCLREKEREEELKACNADRLKWIERYFSHDTDSDDDMETDKNDEEIHSASSWRQEYEEQSAASRSGRGKAVPLQPDPSHSRMSPPDDAVLSLEALERRSLYFFSDPADARTALMSKRSVRLLAQRRMRQGGSRPATFRGAEGRLACVCGRVDDDGHPAVQCDECYNWYHLECIGVQDELELGDEDDPWFCSSCRPSWGTQRQPTFVPTEERPVHTSARSDIAFYSSSPLHDWGSSGPVQTPVHGQGRMHESGFFRRSIWDESHTGPGPSTPVILSRGVPVFTYGEHDHEHMSVFDPLLSSNQKLDMPYSTPKNTKITNAIFGSRAEMMLTSPPSGSAGHDFLGYCSEDSAGASFSASFGQSARANAMYVVDDTPIRRAPARETRTLLPSLHSFSPLAGRGEWSFAGLDESPVARSTTKLEKP